MFTCTLTSYADAFLLGLVVGFVGVIAGVLLFFRNDYDRKIKADKGRMHG